MVQQAHHMAQDFPKVHQVPAAAIAGICVGSLVALLTVSVCAYKCYQKRANQPRNRLSVAIKKGLKQGGGGSMRKSPSLRSPVSSSSKETSPMYHTQPTIGEKGSGNVSKSSSHSPLGDQPRVVKAPDCYVEDETESIGSPEKEDANEKGENETKNTKLGNLHFNVNYDKQKTALLVTVVKATDLPEKDPSIGSSDPYIKLQLLPEKRHKVKTRVLRKTTAPLYDETFTFYGISYNQLQTITLHFVILSFDRFSRDDIIGEVVCPISGLDLSQKEIILNREIQPRQYKIRSQGRGELLVSVCYQPAANRLTVVVLKARNLPKMDITGLSDPYVKIYLLYNGQRIAKKKTHVKKRTLNPVFNESFVFEVPYNEGLQNISFEFLVLDWDRVAKNEVIGRMEIGLNKEGLESQHWNEVMNCPRKQIAEWHKLRE
ncbi:synaptotagmin-4-like [Tubulanus polymorphus]|uniref:synaptotagmin-4-like n=1 Tax=Tubulanus polymorphus TaxID=672921 RepID=UPI003DA62CAC